MTFAEYAEMWLRTHSFDESSSGKTTEIVRKHLLPYFGPRNCLDQARDVREWDSSMVGKLATSTRSVIFAHLRAILSAAVDDERIAKNPCARSRSSNAAAERRVVRGPRPVDGDPRRLAPVPADPRHRRGLWRPTGEIFGLARTTSTSNGGWLHIPGSSSGCAPAVVRPTQERQGAPDAAARVGRRSGQGAPQGLPSRGGDAAMGGPDGRYAGDGSARLHHSAPGRDQPGYLRRQELHPR
jgi:hypothetical protein